MNAPNVSRKKLHSLRKQVTALELKPLPLLVCLAMAWPGAATFAQEAPEAGKLETVTVTGTRRVENIKDVPQSISTINMETLETLNASGQDVRALSGRVPSLNIESDFGRTFPRFYIRGLGNTDFDLNASQPVGLVYDDVVQESPMLKGSRCLTWIRWKYCAAPKARYSAAIRLLV